MIKPPWIRVKVPYSKEILFTQEKLKRHTVQTVCEEASCPNQHECWSQKHAAIMILGTICTRACRFCNVATGKPGPVDPDEPENVALLVDEMNLSHVVITSVDRDDLIDGGADHFVKVIQAIRYHRPQTTIEVLTPDFLNKVGALEKVIDARPDIYNHNIETVARLYPSVRPKARYFHSLYLLKCVKERAPDMFTKSGFMVGLGELRHEISQLMNDLRSANVDFLTIGQYLAPSPLHHPVKEYVPPEEFNRLKENAYKKGFLMVSASALTRSSHHAGKDFQELRQRRLDDASSL